MRDAYGGRDKSLERELGSQSFTHSLLPYLETGEPKKAKKERNKQSKVVAAAEHAARGKEKS